MPPAPTAPFECLPPELLSYILSFVGADVTRCTSSKHVPDYRPLLATSLVARDWSYPSQELLFSTVHLLNGKLRARRKWTECKVEPGKFATRVLVVGGGAWDENAEQLQTMVEKCTRLRTLEIGGHGHISTSLFGSPALSHLQSLTLDGARHWDCFPTPLPFSFALTSLKLTISNGMDAPLPIIFGSSCHSLTILKLNMSVGGSAAVTNFFPLLAPQLEALHFYIGAPDTLHPYFHLLRRLHTLECDGLWHEEWKDYATQLFDALPPGQVRTLVVGIEAWVVRNFELMNPADGLDPPGSILMHALDHPVFKNLTTIKFTSEWFEEPKKLLARVERKCKEKGVKMEWDY